MSTTPLTGAAVMAWNRESGSGRTLFATQQGGGTGGWEWMNYKSDNTVYNPNPQMTLDRDGNLAVTGAITSTGIVRSSGLTLPNAGGTAYGSTLNHYEEYNFATTFSGIYNTGSMTFKITRIGRIVHMFTDSSVSLTSNGLKYLMSSASIPVRFLPANEMFLSIVVFDNANVKQAGLMYIDRFDTHTFSIYKSSQTAFTGVSGFDSLSVSWTV